VKVTARRGNYRNFHSSCTESWWLTSLLHDGHTNSQRVEAQGVDVPVLLQHPPTRKLVPHRRLVVLREGRRRQRHAARSCQLVSDKSDAGLYVSISVKDSNSMPAHRAHGALMTAAGSRRHTAAQDRPSWYGSGARTKPGMKWKQTTSIGRRCTARSIIRWTRDDRPESLRSAATAPAQPMQPVW
jgi:hypothetical protein